MNESELGSEPRNTIRGKLPGLSGRRLSRRSALIGGGLFVAPPVLDAMSGTPTPASAATKQADDVDWFQIAGKPYFTVSPIGLATGASNSNNGADFGPDTSGTTTSGIQEAIDYVVSLGGGKIKLLNGASFKLSSFNSSPEYSAYHAAIIVDSGNLVFGGTATDPVVPIVVEISGVASSSMPSPETSVSPTRYNVAIVGGSTVIDGSGLDVLSFGVFSQGRIFLVPPVTTGATGSTSGSIRLNAVQLKISNLSIVIPEYADIGKGPGPYTGLGMRGNQYLIDGTEQPSKIVAACQFVNGIDGYCAGSLVVENVCIVDPVAGLISTKYAASTPNGSAAGITYPNSSNNGNNVCRGVAIWHLVTGALISSHVVLENYWVQNSGIGIYAPEGSYGSIVVKMQLQESDYCIRRAVLPALTNSLASGQYTPIGDLYGPANLSVPTHALGESHLYISLLNMESLHNALLADDPNYPLTVIANVNLAGNANKQLGSGANLVVNLIGNPAYAQTNVPGTSGGSAVYSQGGVTPWDKRFLIYFDGYENATGTAQTITFVNAFNRIPAVTANETALSTDQFVISAIALTLPVNMTDAITGYFILEGY